MSTYAVRTYALGAYSSAAVLEGWLNRQAEDLRGYRLVNVILLPVSDVIMCVWEAPAADDWETAPAQVKR